MKQLILKAAHHVLVRVKFINIKFHKTVFKGAEFKIIV